MGFRYRKSINLGGGFRINLSKSGIGYSWGTKGYRVTKTARGTTRRTYSIPGTGISWVDETGSGRRRTGNRGRNTSRKRTPQPARQKTPAPRQYQETVHFTQEKLYQNADIAQFKEAEAGTISSSIERTIRLNWIGSILLVCVLLAIFNPVFLLLPLSGIILKILARTKGRVRLEYSFDPEKQDEYNRRIGAWQLLAEGKKEWQILSEQVNSNRKTNAGAVTSIKRVDCKIQKGKPFYIETNVPTIQIRLANKEMLIILPDKVFFVRKRRVGTIDYSDFRISVSSLRFVESAAVPKDAQIVGYTWQYVNKNGTPDRRYKNNRQIPVCLYGQIFLRSSSGLNVQIQVSNNQNAKDFGELIV